MVMGNRKVNLEFRCEKTIIPNSDTLQMLGITVDDMLKFDVQVANICRKVSQQVAVLKRMRNILPYDIRKNIYMSLLVLLLISITARRPGISVIRAQLRNWKK